MITVTKIFLCFIWFSFLGWICEVLDSLVENKKFVNRGFLIGPVCPIYGIGCGGIILLLNRYYNDPIVLVCLAMILCSVLEYFTSYIMEKIFKARWWDYSNMKYNINGRICLITIVPFGVLGALVIYLFYPIFNFILGLFPNIVLYIIAGIILVIFLTDLCLSFKIIMKFKKTAYKVTKDRTEEITKFVKDNLSKNSVWTKRLVESFPNFKIDIKLIKEKLKNMKIKKNGKQD